MSLPQTSPASGSAGKTSVFAAVVVAAVLGIFVIIYVISRQGGLPLTSATGAPDEEKWKFSSEGRAGKLAELRAKEQTLSASYGWVDEKAGVVRLPIDRAVELTIRDLSAVKR
ncbi:MAG: hypothetical protein JNN01_08625 [Opitutaceae bacterium]|nr:hypothetical protein [Opitutaceae bacterium]